MCFYYWEGPFADQLRGIQCIIAAADDWSCPNIHCQTHIATEIKFRPVSASSRSVWHICMMHTDCGCSQIAIHTISMRP